MRPTAFALLVSAAFAWQVPFVDRPGAALLGLAAWALANPLGRSRVRKPAAMTMPPQRVRLPEPPDEPIAGFAERLRPYVGSEPAG